MNKSAFVRARVEPDLKEAAEFILNQLGITPTQAVTMLYRQITHQHEWPTELKVPNAETKKVLSDADHNIDVIHCKSGNVDDLFDKIGI